MFQITEYLDKLDGVEKNGTWIKAVCPICGGTLKISNTEDKKGAYACYTNECHKQQPNPIKKKLYVKTPFTKPNSFTLFKPTISHMVEIVKPPEFTARPKDFLTNIKFQKPEKFINGTDILTYYYYSNNFRMVRVDRYLPENREKFLFEEYKTREGVFKKGMGDCLPEYPFFDRKYIQSSVVFVEGEKTATAGQFMGMATITIPGFLFSSTYLPRVLNKLKTLEVTNVLYLRDNDLVGDRKGQEVKLNLWKLGIACKVVNLADLYGYEDSIGFDLYDLYKETKVNSLNMLEDCLGT